MKTKNQKKSKNGRIIKNLFQSICSILMVSFLASCATPGDKLDSATENATEAQEELNIAQKAYEADVKLFKLDISEKIAANEEEIAVINYKIQNSNVFEKAEYEKQILVLEQKNKNLEKKMNEYKSENRKDWDAFKIKFASDMEELGQALKNFTVK
jgi:hypothetical protein